MGNKYNSWSTSGAMFFTQRMQSLLYNFKHTTYLHIIENSLEFKYKGIKFLENNLWQG